MDTLIIGAGIAGLLAATELQKAGHRVIVLEKGSQVGGRMATQQMLPDALADYGAQFFTVRNGQFQMWVDEWLSAGTATEWCRGFLQNDGHPRYRGSAGMVAIPEHLSVGLNVNTQTKAISIQQDKNRWRVEIESGTYFRSDNLIVTSPIPQSLALLDAGPLQLPDEARQALASVIYDPCFAVTLRLNNKSHILPPGGVQVQGKIIDWISDNQQKGISAEPTVTIHASPEFSRHYLDLDLEAAGNRLIAEADRAGYFDSADIVDVQIHRWLYAKPVNQYPERCLRIDLNRLPLIFAGDAFKHARVEGAALSGLAAASNLLE
ncbi:MAG: renalase [Cellvibrionaceae bacterium]|jgi:renalase